MPVPSRHFPHHLTQTTFGFCVMRTTVSSALSPSVSFGKQSFTAVVELVNPNSQLPFPRKATGLETAEGLQQGTNPEHSGICASQELKLKPELTSQHSQAVKMLQVISSFSLQFTFYFITGGPKRNTTILPHLFYLLGFFY